MDEDTIRRLIEEGLPGARVRVEGDGRHFTATVVAPQFEGKPRVRQHRLVYQALGSSFEGDRLHALALQTYTPAEWEALQA